MNDRKDRVKEIVDQLIEDGYTVCCTRCNSAVAPKQRFEKTQPGCCPICQEPLDNGCKFTFVGNFTVQVKCKNVSVVVMHNEAIEISNHCVRIK